MQVKIKKTHPLAKTPTYGTDGAGCFDIYSVQGGTVWPHGGSMALCTGLELEIPEGYVMLLFSRSGHGFKNNVRLSNCVGVIDSDYRGQLMVKLVNDGLVHFEVQPGDRIAQAMLVPIPRVTFEESEELGATQRGDGGFGSTGT